jgi:hypothetical protein
MGLLSCLDMLDLIIFCLLTGSMPKMKKKKKKKKEKKKKKKRKGEGMRIAIGYSCMGKKNA